MAHSPTQSDAKVAVSDTEPIDVDQRALNGPFDIIGDVHGCYRELHHLLLDLGYTLPDDPDSVNANNVAAPSGRKLIFVGDLVDRGENSMAAVKIVMAFAEAGIARSVCGNHDDKFLRWLKGNKVSVQHGLAGTIDAYNRELPDFGQRLFQFLSSLPLYLWLAGGRLVVVHAGIQEPMLGRIDREVRSFCLYGDTARGRDAAGLPIRYHWAARYQGETTIVYGHTPVLTSAWVNNTLCIDTGCCFGGALTALRWPEGDIVSVDAFAEYAPRLRPFGHPAVRPKEISRVSPGGET